MSKEEIEAAQKLQETQTLEERMIPYVKMIEKLKAEIPQFTGVEVDDYKEFEAAKSAETVNFGEILGFKTAVEYTELIAAMALYEEYELLIDFFSRQEFSDKNLSAKDLLNARVRPRFASWEPTPLYFITGKKSRKMMKDPCKMARFLAEHGADPNVAAGDGSTPLWNMTTLDTPLDILQTLLEIGADPNQIARDGENEYTPLTYCLMPASEENEEGETVWQPLDAPAIEKAMLLLKHGADVNLVSPGAADWPPLMLAVVYGVANGETNVSNALLKLIETLIEKGADINFTNNNGYTPLSAASEKGLKEIEQLLLQHGAKRQEPKKQYETSFNYILTNRVMPQLMFSNPDFFYENIITSPDNMQIFLQKAVAHAAALAAERPDIEPAYPIDKFEMTLIEGKNQNQMVVVIGLPKYDKAADCAAIAIPTSRANAGYYTYEIAVDWQTGKYTEFPFLGEWRPSGDSFRHNNYGEINPCTIGDFAEMVMKHAYGNNANDLKVNLIKEEKPVSKSDNEEAQMFYDRGTQYMIDKQPDKAQYCLMKAVELDPAFMQAIDHLAIVYRRQGNLEEAEKLYLQSLTLDEKNTVPYANLALIYRQMNRLGDAAKMYQRIQQLEPENPESYYGMGALYQTIGEYEKSKEFFDEAIIIYIRTKSNMLYDALYNQGTNFYHLKDYPKALECFEEALKGHPNDEYLQKMITKTKGHQNAASYPTAINPGKVGSYSEYTSSGGGYFFDEVLEYRVWVHQGGNEEDYCRCFPTYGEALQFSDETPGSEAPLVLVLQKEHVNKKENGEFEHITEERITEWLVEWLSEETKRKENSIKEFFKEYGQK